MGSRIHHLQTHLLYAIQVLPGTPAILMTLGSSGSDGHDDEHYSVNEVTVTIFEILRAPQTIIRMVSGFIAFEHRQQGPYELGTNLEVSIEVGAAAVEGAAGLHLKVPRFCRAFKGAGHQWGIKG